MQLRLGFTVEELVERDERLLSQLGRLPAFVQNGEIDESKPGDKTEKIGGET
jgi:hypothetical protein